MTIIINPGTGPVADATYAHALSNVEVFMADSCCHSMAETANPDLGDGRYRFFVCHGSRWHELDMPGVPLSAVRWMKEPDQNIWDFPRLYVDGSSWVWLYAIEAVQPGEEALPVTAPTVDEVARMMLAAQLDLEPEQICDDVKPAPWMRRAAATIAERFEL